jgi:hypothetical protein
MTFEWILIAMLSGIVLGMVLVIALSRPHYPDRY